MKKLSCHPKSSQPLLDGEPIWLCVQNGESELRLKRGETEHQPAGFRGTVGTSLETLGDKYTENTNYYLGHSYRSKLIGEEDVSSCPPSQLAFSLKDSRTMGSNEQTQPSTKVPSSHCVPSSNSLKTGKRGNPPNRLPILSHQHLYHSFVFSPARSSE